MGGGKRAEKIDEGPGSTNLPVPPVGAQNCAPFSPQSPGLGWGKEKRQAVPSGHAGEEKRPPSPSAERACSYYFARVARGGCVASGAGGWVVRLA